MENRASSLGEVEAAVSGLFLILCRRWACLTLNILKVTGKIGAQSSRVNSHLGLPLIIFTRHNNSFSIWRCFVLRYPEQLQAYASFSQIILENLLPQILLDLQSITPTMPHIVLLDISTSNVHLNALLGLSSIPTLTYLRLGSPIPGLIKAWAQQAQESDGFPHLRVLDMLSCDESLVYSLDRLERLPKLLLCRMFPARPHRDQEIPSTKCGPWIDLAKFDGYQKLPVEKPSNPKAHRQKWRRTRSELATIDARSSSKPCALRSVLEFTESLADLLPQKEPPFIHLVYRPCGFPQLSQSQLVASHIWFRLPSDQSRAPTVPKLPPHPPPNPPNAARQLREGRTRDLSEMLGSFGSGLT